jgi:hypothetical protein
MEGWKFSPKIENLGGFGNVEMLDRHRGRVDRGGAFYEDIFVSVGEKNVGIVMR